ncbi:hypothetical protein I3842_05G156500 [Carya illinoinensis]|uniref:Uncharacterized protein n=1 Tax=Carya illinoinensis TaxID=32201 RepID=A0A922F3I9_CARIL|nr:hypothetical protein I3842_05G156500 [Carya illinoinensis]
MVVSHWISTFQDLVDVTTLVERENNLSMGSPPRHKRRSFSGEGSSSGVPQKFVQRTGTRPQASSSVRMGGRVLVAEFVIEPMWVSALLVGLNAIIVASRVTLLVSVLDQFKEVVEVDIVEEQIQDKQCKPGFMLSHPEMLMMRCQRPMMLE